jgi:hypothetical protein
VHLSHFRIALQIKRGPHKPHPETTFRRLLSFGTRKPKSRYREIFTEANKKNLSECRLGKKYGEKAENGESPDLHARISPLPPSSLVVRGAPTKTHSARPPGSPNPGRTYKERAPPATRPSFFVGSPRNPCERPIRKAPHLLLFTPGSPPSPRLPWWLEGRLPMQTELALRARRIPHIPVAGPTSLMP